jgi:trans-aconitate methyltransferase
MPKKNKKKQKSHLGGHSNLTNTDKPVFDEIVEMYDIKSVLDIGCGPAGMKEIAEAKNVKWYGIDGDPKIIETSDNSLLHHHVNCKDLDYWTDCFAQYGYKYDDHYTKKLHSISEMRKDFFKISGMFFFK